MSFQNPNRRNGKKGKKQYQVFEKQKNKQNTVLIDKNRKICHLTSKIASPNGKTKFQKMMHSQEVHISEHVQGEEDRVN